MIQLDLSHCIASSKYFEQNCACSDRFELLTSQSTHNTSDLLKSGWKEFLSV